MNDLDKSLKQVLASNGDGFDDPSLMEMVAGTFHGRMWWMTLMTWFFMLVYFVLAILCAVMFFKAEGTRDLIMFGVLFMWCSVAVMMMKLWNWMLMNRNATTREVKRLELRIARLTEQLEKHHAGVRAPA